MRWCLTKHFVNCKVPYEREVLLLFVNEENSVPEGLSDSSKVTLQVNAEQGLEHKSPSRDSVV